MTDETADPGRGGLKRRNTGNDAHLNAALRLGEVFIRGGIQHLANKGRHGIDAGIARADESDIAALPGQVDGVPHAGPFIAQGETMFPAVLAKIGYEIEIEFIADPVGCPAQRRQRGRRAQFGGAGSDADNRQAAARSPDGEDINRHCGASDGTGRAGANGLGNEELAFRTLCRKAAASATPGQPTSRSTREEGVRSRAASAFSSSLEKKRAGTPSWAAKP